MWALLPLLLLLASSIHGEDVLSHKLDTGHSADLTLGGEDVLSHKLSAGHSEDVLSHKLSAGHSADLTLGGVHSVWCTVDSSLDTFDSCMWRNAKYGDMFVEGDILVDAESNVVGGISVNTTDPRSCHIFLESLAEDDLGSWMCRIQHSAGQQYQEGYIQIVRNKLDVDVRLPTHVTPSSYQLYLIPFLIPDNFTIAGFANINLTTSGNEVFDNITLNILDIIIHEATVSVEADVPLEVVGHGYDDEKNFYIIKLPPSSFAKDSTLTVSLAFTANLNDDLVGFYRSSYTDEETGEQKYLATTQFEATDARRAFPCFDEPAMKATYQVNLGRTKDMSSISNMPVLEHDVPIEGTDYVWDVYQESVKMSTYLVAFVVSDFVYRMDESDSRVEFRIWARQAAFDQTKYASVTGPAVLEYYEKYFDVPFPLPKQDMIAIPDFGSGAMENWGLITYRDVSILYEEGVSSSDDKERVAEVISHELAHMWFGDLVTMEWWTDLWLNEGFAAYVQYIGTDYVQPGTDKMDRFILETMKVALYDDAFESSHPISIPIKHPDEIGSIFDSIAYKKGASMIRMIANFLNIATFNRGITNYLNANKFGNAVQDDLWEFLTQVAHEDSTLSDDMTIKSIMDTWTLQMGYPVLSVRRQYGNSFEAEISQERFLLAKSENSTDDKDYKWWIPISYTSPGGDFQTTSPQIWMSPEEDKKTVQFDGVSADEPLIVNVQLTGFYRVNYDIKNWELIADAISSDVSSVHQVNRAQVLEDSFYLARVGMLDYSTALAMTKYLTKEDAFIPWSSALSGFEYLTTMIKRTAGYTYIHTYLLATLEPLYQKLGFFSRPEDTFTDGKLRREMLKFACGLGHKDCTQQSVELVRQWISSEENDNPVPADIRSTVYCTAVAQGGEDVWDFLWGQYLESGNANEKITIMEALACSGEVWILQRYLDMALGEGGQVKHQDGYRVISGVASNTVGRYVAWDWIRQNWDRIAAAFGNLSSVRFSSILISVTADFNTGFELASLEQFIAEHKDNLGSAERAAYKAVQTVVANVDWMDNYYQVVIDWLKSQT